MNVVTPARSVQDHPLGRMPAVTRHWIGNAHSMLWILRNHPVPIAARLLAELARARWGMQRERHAYAELSLRDFMARRRSRRVFVFGSGYSINEIPDDEWARIARDDTIGFSGSIYLKRVALTFLLLRAWTETSAGTLAWRKDANEVLGAIASNPFLARTAFALQSGLTAIFINRLIAHRMWQRERPMYFYWVDRVSRLPHRDLGQGIVHGKSTLCSAISLAVGLGYEEIVLVGVDLYDSRYFWLPPDKTLGWSEQDGKLVASNVTARGAPVTSTHNTVHNGIIDYLGGWHRHLADRHGVTLSVYNPRSLLTRTMPVFRRKD